MHELLNASFWGVATKAPGALGYSRPLFASLHHYIEWAKFGDGPGLEFGEAAMLMPSRKELLKFSNAHKGHWRSDWAMIRSRVILQGLALLQHQYPDRAGWSAPLVELPALLEGLGLTSVIAHGLVEAHVAQMAGPSIAVLGASSVPAEEVSRRVKNLNRRTSGKWRLLHWQGRHASWAVHDWAATNRIPVRYMAEQGDRLTAQALAMLVGVVDQFIVFEKRGGRSMDGIIATVKRAGRPCEVALWSGTLGSMDLFQP